MQVSGVKSTVKSKKKIKKLLFSSFQATSRDSRKVPLTGNTVCYLLFLYRINKI